MIPWYYAVLRADSRTGWFLSPSFPRGKWEIQINGRGKKEKSKRNSLSLSREVFMLAHEYFQHIDKSWSINGSLVSRRGARKAWPHKSTLVLKKTNSGIRWSAAIININAIGREIALLDLAEASFRPGRSSHGATIDPVIGISRSSNERLGRMEGRAPPLSCRSPWLN